MAKCKKCEKEALEGCDYCASCKEEHDHGRKNVWKCVGSAVVVVAVAVIAFLKGKSGSDA